MHLYSCQPETSADNFKVHTCSVAFVGVAPCIEGSSQWKAQLSAEGVKSLGPFWVYCPDSQHAPSPASYHKDLLCRQQSNPHNLSCATICNTQIRFLFFVVGCCKEQSCTQISAAFGVISFNSSRWTPWPKKMDIFKALDIYIAQLPWRKLNHFPSWVAFSFLGEFQSPCHLPRSPSFPGAWFCLSWNWS